jgi:hypothetical protein
MSLAERQSQPEADQNTGSASSDHFSEVPLATPAEGSTVAPPKLDEMPVEAGADEINQPAHYTQGGIECIDAIQAALTPDEFRGYCKGNTLKYTWRERHKGQDQSIKKAVWYLSRIAA